MRVALYIDAVGVTLAVYDTCVLLAISYRLLRVCALFRWQGADLHAFSRSLFTNGQKYYMPSYGFVSGAVAHPHSAWTFRCSPPPAPAPVPATHAPVSSDTRRPWHHTHGDPPATHLGYIAPPAARAPRAS
ncbi:hypothetical protein GGX14DRAFT_576019 [Mycena pura]|uniref:Uncharacterized protein n=1 Tax=Mycena pura TaxID=153505 RepID=A0AAD6Y3J3_9AGAR|nr:hypothetical protein GGX14DRAFT_576019 [Mycena pura]